MPLRDLSRAAIKALPPGRHRVSASLYVAKSATGGSWVLQYTSPVDGKRHEMGLGSLAVVSLARARELALRHRVAIAEGQDPLTQRRVKKAERQSLTFRRAADEHIDKKTPGWHPRHAEIWRNTLDTYVHPLLGPKLARHITVDDVLDVLRPIWTDKPDTASRLRGRIEKILGHAKGKERWTHENVARWKENIEAHLLDPRSIKPVAHHRALDWQDLPVLWRELDIGHREHVPAIALQLCLLSGLRTEAVLGAQWSEIDIDRKVWVVPAARMKGRKDKRKDFEVPLCSVALGLIERLAALRQNDCLFPGERIGLPINDKAMRDILQRLRPAAAGERNFTTHGTVRAGFRTWSSTHGIPREQSRAFLAQKIAGDNTDEAYLRGTLLQARAKIMERWAQFLTGAADKGKVVALRG
jgi:integrase